MTKFKFAFLLVAAMVFCSFENLGANNTTTRGGCMSVESIAGNQYSLHARLLLSDAPGANDFALVDWGDGIDHTIQLNLFPVSNYNGAFLVSIDAQHTYSIGSYTLSLQCGRRVPWIRNMQNSDTSTFSLQAAVVVDPNIGANSGPVNDTTNLEAEMTMVVVNTISMTAPDPENDSVVWSRTIPPGAIGYAYPEISGGGNFNLSPALNNYEWNPQTPGLYSVCFSFTQWHESAPGNWVLIGYTTREVLLDAGTVSALSEQNINHSLVYPNPASEILSFQFSGSQQSRTIIIYDQLGREIWREESNENLVTVSVRHFAEGIYFYRVVESANLSSTGKFVVEK